MPRRDDEFDDDDREDRPRRRRRDEEEDEDRPRSRRRDDEDDRPRRGGDRDLERKARDMTSVPGIFLIVLAVLNFFWVIGCGVAFVRWTLTTPTEWVAMKQQEAIEKMRSGFPVPPQNLDLRTYEQERRGYMILSAVCGVLGLTGVAFPLIAGIRMRSLQSYGLCLTGAVIAMVPVLSGMCLCCGLGLGVGLWAMIVLLSADVRAAFH